MGKDIRLTAKSIGKEETVLSDGLFLSRSTLRISLDNTSSNGGNHKLQDADNGAIDDVIIRVPLKMLQEGEGSAPHRENEVSVTENQTSIYDIQENSEHFNHLSGEDLGRDYISVNLACEICGFSPSTVRAACRSNKLTVMKQGREWRILRSSLQGWKVKKK